MKWELWKLWNELCMGCEVSLWNGFENWTMLKRERHLCFRTQLGNEGKALPAPAVLGFITTSHKPAFPMASSAFCWAFLYFLVTSAGERPEPSAMAGNEPGNPN